MNVMFSVITRNKDLFTFITIEIQINYRCTFDFRYNLRYFLAATNRLRKTASAELI